MDIARSLFETLKSLCRILGDARVEYCLIGGLAVGILSKPRATEDIDLLVLIDEERIPSLMSLLREHLNVIQEGHIMRFPQATIWRTVIGSPAGEEGGCRRCRLPNSQHRRLSRSRSQPDQTDSRRGHDCGRKTGTSHKDEETVRPPPGSSRYCITHRES